MKRGLCCGTAGGGDGELARVLSVGRIFFNLAPKNKNNSAEVRQACGRRGGDNGWPF